MSFWVIFDGPDVSTKLRWKRSKIEGNYSDHSGFLAKKRPNLAKNCHFWPNLGIFGPFDPMPDQKNNLNKLPRWFFVVQGMKWAKTANIWPKMTKNAYFGPNLAVFGPKILIFMGVSKSFGTNITENHFGNLSALFFGQALDQMGQKWPYFAQNASFGPNLTIFWPKIQFFWERE